MEAIVEQIGLRTTAGLAVFVAYVALCRGLRFRRRDRKHAQYPFKTREDFKNMTGEDAFKIVEYVQAIEFPFTSKQALQFALFKTYGIPSISKLLCETQQLGKVEYAGRRYADTSILIVEFLANSPASERANSAIARMNWLHGRYQKAGKISNDDMLYTLSLFVLEVPRWVNQYEWRTLTPMETCGIATHWKGIGDAMNIDMSDLKHGPNNFKDGLEFYEDILEWSEEYERKAMVPNKWNHQLAEETTAILLTDVPKSMKPMAKQLVITLMTDKLRKAMLYDQAPAIYPKLINAIFGFRRFVAQNLLPPRPYMWRNNPLSEKPDAKGRYFTIDWDNQPWYVKPTFFTRHSPLAYFRWVIGGPYPDGKNYKPEGYKIFEVGPKRLEGQGEEECQDTLNKLMKEDRGGCPFAFAK